MVVHVDSELLKYNFTDDLVNFYLSSILSKPRPLGGGSN